MNKDLIKEYDNDTARAAKICVPLKSEFEKDGIWINRQFRAQRFDKAIDAPKAAVDDIEFISRLLREASGENFTTPTVAALRGVIADKIEAQKPCRDISAAGAQIDGAKFAGVDFPEEDAMLFKKNQHIKAGD